MRSAANMTVDGVTGVSTAPDADVLARWAALGRSIAHEDCDFLTIFDRVGRYLYMNQTVPGLRVEDFVGKASAFDFADPLDHETMRAAFERAFVEGQISSYDVSVPTLGDLVSQRRDPTLGRGPRDRSGHRHPRREPRTALRRSAAYA